MPLVSALPYIKHARDNHYAIPLFEFFEPSGCEDMVRALEEKRAAAIFGIYSATLDQTDNRALLACVRELAKASTAPISVMLDHGASADHCKRALDMGFTDVMYDGSAKPIEENIANTRKVVEMAHAAGAGVEAELGHVGGGHEYQTYGAVGKGFSQPDAVERFVRETGVDVLAIAFGNAHGVYKGEPKLNLQLLADIRGRVSIPLVMHGGSGLSEDQFRGAIRTGIAKVNIATDILICTKNAIAAASTADKASYFSIFKALHATTYERCCYYLDLFGTSGQAAGARN